MVQGTTRIQKRRNERGALLGKSQPIETVSFTAAAKGIPGYLAP